MTQKQRRFSRWKPQWMTAVPKNETHTVRPGFENQTVCTKVKTTGSMADFMEHDPSTCSGGKKVGGYRWSLPLCQSRSWAFPLARQHKNTASHAELMQMSNALKGSGEFVWICNGFLAQIAALTVLDRCLQPSFRLEVNFHRILSAHLLPLVTQL